MTTSVAAALAAARAAGVARLDAELLLARVLATTRTSLIARDERFLSTMEEAQWSGWLARRAAGEPLAYIVGEKEFHGLVLEVNADVLVPRPETELAVDWASALLDTAVRPDGRASDDRPLTVVDLGTGSGAIALALKHRHPDVDVVATDRSVAALAVAQRNAARLGLALEVAAGVWWEPLGGRRFDVAVANPPYVGAADPHLEALRHEPIEALTPGGDGMAALRTVIAGAPAHLAGGGWLVVEHGHDQGAAVRACMCEAGFEAVETRRDLAGLERTTAGRLPAAA